MTTKKGCIGVLSFFFLLTHICPIVTADSTPALLQLMILDESGALVPSAHVYIFSQDKKKFFGSRDVYATDSVNLPPGHYRVYAALTRTTHGIVDHYSSPEATVNLSVDQPTSVILSLRKAENSELYLNDTARKKMGIDEELSKNLN